MNIGNVFGGSEKIQNVFHMILKNSRHIIQKYSRVKLNKAKSFLYIHISPRISDFKFDRHRGGKMYVLKMKKIHREGEGKEKRKVYTNPTNVHSYNI